MKRKCFFNAIICFTFFGLVLTGCNKQGLTGPQGEQGVPGEQGQPGQDGRSVVSIEYTSSEGNVDTYTITYSDGTTSTFTVTNGTNGENGQNGQQGAQGEQGIQGNPGADGHTPVVTIGENGNWFVDGVDTGIKAQGPQGPAGENGVSIVSIEKTSSDGLVDTYTITYSNGTTTTFTVTNGADGEQGIQGLQGPQGDTGVSVVSAVIDDNGDLIITFSNDQVINAGHIKDVSVFTVTFHIGNIVICEKQVEKGNTVDRPTPEETYGYNVIDWYYIDGSNHESWKFFAYVITKDIDLYAEYTILDKYAISFIDNENHQTPDRIMLYNGEQYTLPTLSFPQYSFIGWKDGSNTLWNQTGTYNLNTDVVLYACWEKVGFTITLNPNGGEINSTSINVTINEPYTIPTPTKLGFIFSGWFDEYSVQFPSSGTWTKNYDLTLTAAWAELDPNLYIFDLDGGRCSSDSVNIIYGHEYSLPIPIKNGCFFNGWYLNDIYIPNSGIWTISSETGTLTAHWVSSEIFTLVLKGEDSYKITACSYSGSERLIIPNKFNGLIVDEISSRCFYGMQNLTSIIIPNSITSIGDSVFYNCSNLSSIVIGSGVTSIGIYAFYNCSSLTSIVIPDSVTSISGSMFANCINLTSVAIGNGVTSIGNGAFYGCSSLISITIPDSVTSIGESVFNGCSSLKSIAIPFVGASVNPATTSPSTLFGYLFGTSSYTGGVSTSQSYSNGSSAQYYIPSTLKEVTISRGAILYGAFKNCSNLTSITLGDRVASIGYQAFCFCSKLTSITIPDSVTSIGYQAFGYCSKLSSAVIGRGVRSISSNIFSCCPSLKSITVPFVGASVNPTTTSSSTLFGYLFGSSSYTGGVSTQQYYSSSYYSSYYIPSSLKEVTVTGGTIFYGAFQNCSNLTSITLGDGVTSIDSYAFQNCSNITSITIPNSVTSIGSYAFQNCSNLTSVTIGNGVTSIGENVFNGCSSLESITVPFVGALASASTASSLTLFGYLFGTSSYTGGVYTSQYYSNGNYSNYYIPSSLKEVTVTGGDIFYGAFQNCSNLTSITTGDGVTSIGDYAFKNCSNLTSITIGDGVTSIGNYAFYGCTSLTSITIPDSVTSLGYYAFYGCTSLTSITIPDSVTSIVSYAFQNCSNLTSVTIGNSVTSIGGRAFYGCSSLISIAIPDSVTSIGDSAFQNCSNLTSITIGDGVTSIGRYAFDVCPLLDIVVADGNMHFKSNNNCIYNHDMSTLCFCSQKVAGSFVVPDSVTSIDSYAFYRCTSITSITIPDSVTSIGNYAFYGCTSLTLVTIPDSVTSIGDRAFYGCSSLISIAIPDSVTSIGDSAFHGCTSLTSITIPDSVTSIGSYAFQNCSNLTSITIGDCVSSIVDGAFYGCTSITSITIPDSITSIGDSAFSGCTSLTSITIPDSVTSIGDSAFRNCTNLCSVIIGSSVDTIGNYAFYGCLSNITFYYVGNASAWNSITKGSGNTNLVSNNIYYYLETFPDDAGNYWHYVNGIPTVW